MTEKITPERREPQAPRPGRRGRLPGRVKAVADGARKRKARARGNSEGLRPSAQIVPPQAVAGRALLLVVAIMSFLACLTIGMVTVIHDAANRWVGGSNGGRSQV